MQKITPFLWFDSNAEEAVDHYVSIFQNSKKGAVSRYGPAGPMPEGSVMTVAFQLEGQDFIALNGGPGFKFNESMSFVVSCEVQTELDRLWEKLTSEGGEPGQCGWLKDKFGVSWQVVPAMLPQWVSDKDPHRATGVIQALMQMTKLDISTLKRAASSGTGAARVTS